MNKKVMAILIAIIVIIAIVVIVKINNDDQTQQTESQYTNISTDTFVGTVISVDKQQITIIPNEDELIRQSSFEIINAIITKDTKIYNQEIEDTVDSISINDGVKVTFDGKIYEVKPGKIIAQKVELLQKANIEE